MTHGVVRGHSPPTNVQVERYAESEIHTEYGPVKLVVFRAGREGAAVPEEHSAVVFGPETVLAGPASTPAVMVAYELDKALYELDYERAHRPDWVPLPMSAIHRLVDGGDDSGE